MHPITRREKLKKDLTDLIYFAKKVKNIRKSNETMMLMVNKWI